VPYNPGITDISGQLLGRGMESAAQARAQGMGAIGNAASGVIDFFAKRQEENKDVLAKTRAAEQFLKTHADTLAPINPQTGQADPEKILQFLEADPNENAKQRYSRLTSGLDMLIQGKKMEQVNAENKLRFAQAEEAKAKMDEQKRQNAFISSLLAQEGLGVPNPVTGGQQAVGPQEPGVTPQTQQVAAQAARFANPEAAQAVEAGAAQAPQGAAQAMRFASPDWRNREVPPSFRDALVELAKNGQRPTNTAQIGAEQARMQKEWRDNRSAGVLYKDEDSAQTQADEFNKNPNNMGVVALVQPDAARGGFVIKKQTTSLKTPGQEAAATAAIEEAKITAKRAGDLNDQIAKEALDAVQDRPRLQRIRELYNAGVQTGFGQDWVTAAQSAMSGLGYGDKAKTAQKEELRSLLDQDALAKAQKYLKGGGSISNQERNQLSAISQSFGKVEGSNLALINMTEAAYNKSEAAEALRQSLEDQGKSEREIASELRKWIRSNPLDRFATNTGIPPKGTRVMQGGVTYESDGFGMREVK
jgi:hypothetical protein